MMLELPLPGASVTVLLATGLPFASNSVTVIVEYAEPLAKTEVGLATTVELAGLTAAI
jgi:hypothetical protein